MGTRMFGFAGGKTGPWRIVRMDAISGEPLSLTERLSVLAAPGGEVPPGADWLLRGITSNERYVFREEKESLVARQPALGRAEATCAALIPIRKSPAWWSLPQDERREIFEEHSRHIHIGRQYLPDVARRLHHCRDLGEEEPFDFLTWFEYSPANEIAFDELVRELRASQEWRYVDREIDIRLVRDPV